MSKSTKRHPQSGKSRSPTFKMRPIAIACSSLLFIAGSAYAAEPVIVADDAAMETVVVTGMRHSIETSIAAKKNNDSIVEVVSAEDIGKLPDISIAESLSRLPGVTAERVDGRPQVISIRGMAPKFGVTLLNGREIVSTGDNRSVEYDQFPSELINSATVYKTPDAALSAMGLSGTVDMRSVRPLDYTERKVNFSIRGEYNDNGALNEAADKYGNRISASYINQFADNTIGVALGYARLDNPGQEKYYKNGWWGNTSAWGQAYPGLPAGTTALQYMEAGTSSVDKVRNGFMAELEYKPNKDFHSMVDLYYSKFDQKGSKSELQLPFDAWNGAAYSNPTFTQVGGSNVATGGSIVGINQTKILNRNNVRKDDIFAIGWNNELKNDKWTLAADISYSKANRDENNGELTAGFNTPVTLSNVALATGSGLSSFTSLQNFADSSLITLRDPGGWGRDGRNTTTKVVDEMKAIKFSVKRDLDFYISSLEGGVNYSDRTKDMNKTEVYYNLKNGRTPVSIGANLLKSTSLDFIGIPGLVSWDYAGALAQYYDTTAPQALNQQPGRTWGVQEKITTFFGKAGIDIDAKIPIRGNFGVQVVHADQTGSGVAWNGVGLSPTTDGKARTDVLPSLNLIFDLENVVSKGALVRIGAAREMARPNMEDMRGGYTAGVGGLCSATVVLSTCKWSGQGGNPKLDPWMAKAYDISFEKYFGKRSYIGAAFFVKDLSSFVYKQDVDKDFAGTPNSSTNLPGSTIGRMTTLANGHGGMIHGQELSGAIDGALLSSSLDGFGFTGSLSHTTSSINETYYVGDGEVKNLGNTIEGMSGIVRTLTAYYEKNGFSARISQRYRSKFMAQTRGIFNDVGLSAIEPEKLVDLQVGYAFEDGSYKGLSVLFQVNNLTDEPYRTSRTSATDSTSVLPEKYNTYGRQFLLGASYKF